MKFFSIILFLSAFLLFQTLFGWIVSSKADNYTLANQIFGFLFVAKYGDWFLKHNNKWFYIFCLSIFYIAFGFLIQYFGLVMIDIIISPITIYLAFKTLKNKSYIKNGIIILIFSIISSYYILPNYFQFYTRYKYKKDTTKIIYDFPNISYIDNNKEIVTLDKEKIIVLDFWTTSCGVCFEEFPLYSDLASKYENDNRIEFYAVNVPLKRDIFEKSVEMIQKHNYSFKSIYVSSEQEAKEKLNLYAYPEIMIIKNNTILYQGHPSYKKIVVIDNFDKIISNLLK